MKYELKGYSIEFQELFEARKGYLLLTQNSELLEALKSLLSAKPGDWDAAIIKAEQAIKKAEG